MREPSVYAKLMDAALGGPRQEVRDDVESILRGRGLAALTESLIEHVNHAYVAGVRDGFADAVIAWEGERAEARAEVVQLRDAWNAHMETCSQRGSLA